MKSLEQKFFNWEGWDPGEIGEIFFYDVEFITDFGVFKSGDKFTSIFVSYKTGKIEAYFNNHILKTQHFTLAPIG